MDAVVAKSSAWCVAMLSAAGIACADPCDLDAPRFEPTLATLATSHPRSTRVPRTIEVELAGFATRAEAAKCFGRRYHELRRAEYITAIVQVGEGWGYLTPGKGGRNVRKVATAPLFEAYRAAGFRLFALAHTHPYGTPHFSDVDLAAMLKAGSGEFYMTNWRNETWRMDAAMVSDQLEARAWRADQRGVRRLARHLGFEGERVE